MTTIEAANELTCNTTGIGGWNLGLLKTCSIKTAIDSDGFTFSSVHEELLGLWLGVNEKTVFLPIKVNENFPNLIAYAATECSIKTIERKNFEKLNKLKVVRLEINQIEKISSDTFEDLLSLEYLYLCKFLIRFVMIEDSPGPSFFRQQQDQVS